MIARLLCWLYMGHFVRRYPSINCGPVPSWKTRARCWCGHYDITVGGLCSQEDAQARAREALALSGWGVQ